MNTKKRLTRVQYQKGLRMKQREQLITDDLFEIERFALFLLALALLLDLITGGVALANAVVNSDYSDLGYLIISIACYYFIQYATQAFENDLINNHQKLSTEKVQIEYIVNLLKSIKGLFK